MNGNDWFGSPVHSWKIMQLYSWSSRIAGVSSVKMIRYLYLTPRSRTTTSSSLDRAALLALLPLWPLRTLCLLNCPSFNLILTDETPAMWDDQELSLLLNSPHYWTFLIIKLSLSKNFHYQRTFIIEEPSLSKNLKVSLLKSTSMGETHPLAMVPLLSGHPFVVEERDHWRDTLLLSRSVRIWKPNYLPRYLETFLIQECERCKTHPTGYDSGELSLSNWKHCGK